MPNWTVALGLTLLMDNNTKAETRPLKVSFLFFGFCGVRLLQFLKLLVARCAVDQCLQNIAPSGEVGNVELDFVVA